MRRDFGAMLEQVKRGGRLSLSEVRAVHDELASASSEEDPYTLLHIVGLAGDSRYEAVVRQFARCGLGDPDDDGMLRRLAIQILGQWWKLRDAFDLVASAANSDPNALVRAVAASALGDLGLQHRELRGRAATLLLHGLDCYAKEQRDAWGAFYEGALTLAGVDAVDRPLCPGELTPTDLDPAVLARLRAYASLV